MRPVGQGTRAADRLLSERRQKGSGQVTAARATGVAAGKILQPTYAGAMKPSLSLSARRPLLAETARIGLKLGEESRLRSASQCSTASSGFSRCSEVSESEPSDPGSPCSGKMTPKSSRPFSEARQDTVTIFDWDDTLVPTSWLRSVRPRGPMPVTAKSQTLLAAHARLVEQTLRKARTLGPVAIVTLARPNWLRATAADGLPGLDVFALFKELDIDVYHSRDEDCPGAFEAEDWERLKRASMERCLRSWHEETRELHLNRRNVLCIGDATIEHDAMRSLFADNSLSFFEKRPVCKTVKLMDSPQLPELHEELLRLSGHLKRLASSRREFDYVVSGPTAITPESLADL